MNFFQLENLKYVPISSGWAVEFPPGNYKIFFYSNPLFYTSVIIIVLSFSFSNSQKLVRDQLNRMVLPSKHVKTKFQLSNHDFVQKS